MADERVVTTEDVDPREYAQLLAQGMTPADLPPQQSEGSVIAEQRAQMVAEREALRQERTVGTDPLKAQEAELLKQGQQQVEATKAAIAKEQAARNAMITGMRPEYEALDKTLADMEANRPQRPALPTFPQVPNRGQYIDQTAAKSLFAVASLMGALAMAGGRGRGMLAMAGLTGAMQGFREGNMEKYKAGKDEYDRQVEQQLLQYKMMHQDYLDQMTEQNLTLEQRMSRLQLKAKMYGDQVTDAAAAKQDADTVFKQINDLGKMTAEMQKASQADILAPLKIQAAQLGIQGKQLDIQKKQIELSGQQEQAKFAGLTGEELLKALPAGDAALVKKVANYEMPIAGFGGMDAKTRARILPLVSMYDPSFDATQYMTKLSLRKDFTSGKAAQNVRSLNTVVGHLDSLKKAADKLDNSPIQLWNQIANYGLTQTGDSRVTTFNLAANAVESELATVFKNTGATDQEIKAWRQNLSAAQSPQQLHDAINQAIELLGSRLQALNNQYEQGMGKPKEFKLLSDKSREILKKLGANVDQMDPGIGGALETQEPGAKLIGKTAKGEFVYERPNGSRFAVMK